MAARTKRDYYEILGVSRSSSQDEIKRAFRALAKQKHPDVTKNPNDAEEFKKISEAYDVLGDPEKRKLYDAYGHEGVNGAGSGFSGFQSAQGFGDINSFFEDFIGDLFGGGRGHSNGGFSRSSNAGADMVQTISISFSEAVLGKKQQLNLNVEVGCNACNKTGARTPQDYVKCGDCNGSGIQVISSRSIFGGAFKQQTVCNTCQGIGRIIKQKCLKCKGNRFYIENQTLQFNIPPVIFGPGTDTQHIKPLIVKNKGHVSRTGSGAQGNLIIQINIIKDKYFQRLNSDLVINIPVSYLDALLGKEITIPTIDGKIIKKTLTQGTQNQDQIIISHQGCYNPNGRRGNLVAIISIKLPKKLTRSEKTALELLAKEDQFIPNEEFITNFIKGK